ncbi:MAG: L-rhamnose/proton symporter RhaT [Acidobacteriota bacterium]
METSHWLTGMLLILVGGMMEGSFALPLKLTPKWNWENIWGAGSFMALLLVPWPLATLTIPHLSEVYRSSPAGSLWMALLFGAGWGVGGVFFGLAVNAVGLSIGLSLIFGLIAINGSLIPLVLEYPEQLVQKAGLMVLGGIAVMSCGLTVCALAGRRRDRELQMSLQQGNAGFARGFARGVIFW